MEGKKYKRIGITITSDDNANIVEIYNADTGESLEIDAKKGQVLSLYRQLETLIVTCYEDVLFDRDGNRVTKESLKDTFNKYTFDK